MILKLVKPAANWGKQQEALSLCMYLLNQRFGEVDSLVIERVQVLSVEQLEALGGRC